MDVKISGEILDMYLYGKARRGLDHLFANENICSTDIPKDVVILPSTVPGSTYGVFSKVTIPPGTRLGPFRGNLVEPCSCCLATRNDNCWEVVDKNGFLLAYMVGDSGRDHWLMHVQCARSEREQNLDVVQMGHHIYYRAIKEIRPGSELLVWYGSTYKLHIGIPVFTHPDSRQTTHKAHVSNIIQTGGEDSFPVHEKKQYRWRCVICKRGFNSRSNLRSHMRTHTHEKPFVCKFCGRRFSQSSTLRNHVRLHTGEKPYTCISCNSSYSQLAGLRAHQRSATHKPVTSS